MLCMKRAHHDNASSDALDMFSIKRVKLQEELGLKRTFPINLSQGAEVPVKQRRLTKPDAPSEPSVLPPSIRSDCLEPSNKREAFIGGLYDFLARDQHRLVDHTIPNSEGLELIVYQPPLLQQEHKESSLEHSEDTMDTT